MPTRITLSLEILTPSVGLVWLRVMGRRVPPLFTLLTTLARDLRWSIVDIKPDPLVASVVNLCGIILGPTPVVKTGEPVTPDRIPRAFIITTKGIPDPTGVDFCPKKGYDKNPWEYHLNIKIGAILYRLKTNCVMQRQTNMKIQTPCLFPSQEKMKSTEG